MQQAPSHRILLAEEQAVSRDLVVLVLGKLGYRIETVTIARDLLQRVGARPPALLLLSSTLADRAGAKLLNQIRAGSSGDCLPVAMIGPQIDERSGEAYLNAGAIDYLSRPIDIERLLRVVERAVRSRPPAPSTGPDAEPVIDLDHLSGFTDGDLQLEGELLALFLSTSGVYLERMREALGTGQSWPGARTRSRARAPTWARAGSRAGPRRRALPAGRSPSRGAAAPRSRRYARSADANRVTHRPRRDLPCLARLRHQRQTA